MKPIPPQPQTTSAICGQPVDPTVADQGQATSLPVAITCEAPTLPAIQCDDDEYTTEYVQATGTFRIVARIFDQNCGVITDQSGQAILTTIS